MQATVDTGIPVLRYIQVYQYQHESYRCLAAAAAGVFFECPAVTRFSPKVVHTRKAIPTSGQNRYAGKTGMALLLWKGFVKNSQFWGLFGMLLLLVYF